MKVSGVTLAVVFAGVLLLMHAMQVDLLSGSLSEYWHRRDKRARWSKFFLLLSLLSCAIVPFWAPFAFVLATALFIVHATFSMNEFR